MSCGTPDNGANFPEQNPSSQRGTSATHNTSEPGSRAFPDRKISRSSGSKAASLYPFFSEKICVSCCRGCGQPICSAHGVMYPRGTPALHAERPITPGRSPATRVLQDLVVPVTNQQDKTGGLITLAVRSRVSVEECQGETTSAYPLREGCRIYRPARALVILPETRMPSKTEQQTKPT